MKNGKDKGLIKEPQVIRPHFGAPIKNDMAAGKEITDKIRTVNNLINKDLARPAEMATGSSIPPRSPEAKAQVIKFRRTHNRTKRTVYSERGRSTGKKRETFNEWLMREKATPTIESISGGVRQQVNTENMAEDNERAKKLGYAGVRKVYLMIQERLHDESGEYFDYDKKASQMAARISQAVRELQDFYNFRDEDGEPVFTDDPRDPRLFNAVASVLIRVWGHNYLNKLDDLRVNSIVKLLHEGDVSWRKLIDLMVEWEKSPSVKRTVNRYNR